MAFIFRVDQSQISRWISFLQIPFQSCTSSYIQKHRKKITSLAKLKSLCPQINLIIDASKRPIRTPKFNQNRVYSGKKKIRTIKNRLIISDRRIFDVSDTFIGKVHDFKIFKKNIKPIPKGLNVTADTGFVGIEGLLPDNKCFIAYKASKNYPLEDYQK